MLTLLRLDFGKCVHLWSSEQLTGRELGGTGPGLITEKTG
jgi:hypothetical protein